MKPKVIELRGVEFINKGAELMLLAIKERVLKSFPNSILVMELSGRTPRHRLKENGIYTKLNFQRFKVNFHKYGGLIPKALRRRNLYILESEVDIVLEASGFAYGDQWGVAYGSKRLARVIENWKKNGKKIILLPQAFGPFSDPEIISMMEHIIKNSDLIFAREEESFKHLIKIKNEIHIKRAPDFTNLLNVSKPIDFDKNKYNIAIIPNYKMIEKSSGSGKEYYEFLGHVIKIIQGTQYNPFFLIHEGKRDRAIAEKVNINLGANSIQIIDPGDALKIKGIIQVSKFIISSRFHGVISALSQGVPCMITSWSHKYKFLAKEYDSEDLLVEDLSDFNEIEKILGNLLDDYKREIISEKLSQYSLRYKNQSQSMWSEVEKIIKT